MNLLGLGILVIDGIILHVKLIGEVGHQSLDIEPRLIIVHVRLVKIPVEMGLSLLLQIPEHTLFYGLHQVEAHKQVGLVGRGRRMQVLGNLPVQSTLVSQSLLRQTLVEIMIDSPNLRPDIQEPLLQDGVLVVREIPEEPFDSLTLFVGEVTHVVVLVDIAQIGKHLVGIRHILVQVVEIGQQQLSPTVEMIQRLVGPGDGDKRLVQVAHQFDGVGHRQFPVLTKQVADGHVGRTPYGLVRQPCQLTVQE